VDLREHQHATLLQELAYSGGVGSTEQVLLAESDRAADLRSQVGSLEVCGKGGFDSIHGASMPREALTVPDKTRSPGVNSGQCPRIGAGGRAPRPASRPCE